MTMFDNYIEQTVKQYHGRPIQKRLRNTWFMCTTFLMLLWTSIINNSAIRHKKCFVRHHAQSDTFQMLSDESDTRATDLDVSADFDFIVLSLVVQAVLMCFF